MHYNVMTFFVTHDVGHYGDVIKRGCKHLCQPREHRAPCCCTTMHPVTKQGPQLRTWKSSRCKSCPILPTWPHVTFGYFPPSSQGWLGGSSEFRAARYTCIGVPQRLSAVAQEAATLWGERRRVLQIMLKFSTPWLLYFLRYDTTCRTYWMTQLVPVQI